VLDSIEVTATAVRNSILAAVATLVGAYYLWQVRVANGPFEWGYDLNGHYYDLLGQAFAHGHFYLPVNPSPELLALKDPYDPNTNAPFRNQDMVLYRGRYFLYFGAAPALLVFTPFRLLTGHDVSQHFALALLCFGAFLFSCGALLRILDKAGAPPGPVFLTFLLLALGVCTPIPFLLNRGSFYELPIACGAFCLAGGMFFLVRSRMAPAGAMFALAVASRPHLVFAGLIVLTALAVFEWRKQRRAVLTFALAFGIGGALIAAYNFGRFGNPLEFGFRYQLGGPGQNRLDLGTRNLVPGAYYTMLSKPEIGPVFPWMRMVFRFPFDSPEHHPLPPEYFVEPSVGALWTTPFLLAAFWIWPKNRWIGVAAIGGAAIILFLMSTHLSSQRYQGDFVPLLVLAALANLALARSRAVHALACMLIVYSAVSNLALGLAGPYEGYLKSQPESYVRLARHFSLGSENRLELNPRIHIRLAAHFTAAGAGYREPLVTIGHSHYCYFLYAERAADGVVLVSKTNETETKLPVPAALIDPLRLDVQYAPETGDMTLAAAGGGTITHHVGPLVAAPATVVTGANMADMGLTARKFLGNLDVLEKTVVRR
jgi:hypothetical protein